MREQQMRLRVFQFLKARMRNMVMPATVGIGIAVGGCTTSTEIYSAPLPRDGSRPDGVSQHNLDVPPSSDATDSTLGRDTMPTMDLPAADSPISLGDAGADAGAVDSATPVDGGAVDASGLDGAIDRITTKYIAPIQDAGPDTLNTKYIAPVYIAPTPDAGADGTPAVRYMAQMPDGDVSVPVYMAPMYIAQQPS